MNNLEESYVRLNGGQLGSTFAAEVMPQDDNELGKMPSAPPPPKMPSETHGERTGRLHGEGQYKHEVKKATTPLAPPRPQAAPVPQAPVASGAAPVPQMPMAPAPVPVGGGVQPIAPPQVAPALPNPAVAQQPVPQAPTPQQTPTPPAGGVQTCPHCQRPMDTMQQAAPAQGQ